MAIKERIKTLLDKLNKGIFEKEEVMALALLSSIAGESIFLLGPPGVAKSLIARRLKYAYKDAKVFEYLMSRFSTPDEIFGPVSIQKLKNEDKYERVIDKYLPSADVVFLDEIWKAGPSIQNALLTVINEKIFRNGDEELEVPMKALISASNELPAKDQGLEALWDRFLVRFVVNGIEDKEKFNKMISEKLNAYEDNIEKDEKITKEEYQKWGKKIDEINIPDNVFNVIHYIRNYIAEEYNKGKKSEEQIYVSDRRWRKIVKLLRTSAFLNDRSEVDLMDCFLIKHCIWNEKEQRDTAFQYVSESIEKYGYTFDFDFSDIEEEIKELEEDIKKETKHIKDNRVEVLVNAREKYYEIKGLNRNDYHTSNKPTPLLLLISDYDALTTGDSRFYTYYYSSYYSSDQRNENHNIRKGKDKYHVIIDGSEYKLKTRIDGDRMQQTRKPHKSVENTWDNSVVTLLKTIDKWMNDIEKYRSKDLEHIRTNIFVDSSLAIIVEKSILNTSETIKQIESNIKQIQLNYKKLEDEEVVLNG